MTKNSVCRAPYLWKHTSYDCHLWYTSVKWWYLLVFFSFFQNFGFSGCEWCKVAKNDPKWQEILSHSISQEAYIIWSWFLVHRCKMKKSPKTFSISSKFWFSGLLEGQKMAEYDKKFCLSLCLRNCTSYCGFWYTRVKSWYLQQRFSCFQNSDFPGVWGVGRWGSAKNVKKMQKMTHNYQF